MPPFRFLPSPTFSDSSKSIAELQKALDSHKARDGSFDAFRYELLKTLSSKKVEKFGDCLKDKSEHQEADNLFCQAFAENEALIARMEIKAHIDKKPCNNAVAYERRGVNLYQMGHFRNAVKAHDEAFRIDKTYLSNVINRGYAKFASADFNGAAEDFGNALYLLKRDQADTMITWLYLSQEHYRILIGDRYYQLKNRDQPSKKLKDNALELLELNLKDWRIKLFLGNELPHNVKNPDDVLNNVEGADKQCKMYFYIGEWYALKQSKYADEWLRQAVKVCPFDLVERSAAKAELEGSE
jgi:tetratricopeptide (TPR) repeat protein